MPCAVPGAIDHIYDLSLLLGPGSACDSLSLGLQIYPYRAHTLLFSPFYVFPCALRKTVAIVVCDDRDSLVGACEPAPCVTRDWPHIARAYQPSRNLYT